jgi:hypothetical protein
MQLAEDASVPFLVGHCGFLSHLVSLSKDASFWSHQLLSSHFGPFTPHVQAVAFSTIPS